MAPTPRLPFSVDDKTDHPISLYAATKKANELMAHSYSHLYRLPVTVCDFLPSTGRGAGPIWRSSCSPSDPGGTPIKLFNHGKMRRDFTYIDDVTRVVLRLVDQIPRDAGAGAARRRGSTMSAIIIRKS